MGIECINRSSWVRGPLRLPNLERTVKEKEEPTNIGLPLKPISSLERTVTESENPQIVQSTQAPIQKDNKPNEIKPISYKTNDFKKDSEEVLLARMLFGEARNCSNQEKIAVAYTAINRVNDNKRWNGTNIKGVILKPWQYSCFNLNDPNRKKLMDPEKYDSKSWQTCLEIAKNVLSGNYSDSTNGATHYFNPSVVVPEWSKRMEKKEVQGTKHDFYREI